MRLKRLDIFAFKSFMDRTSLRIPPGISAIVGPNGCGKSNLIDAIRWAIGEQSVRSLRGRLMEDVIFAGTHAHRALGLAEVSLTLEPGNGHPGLEAVGGAAEVTVTRRLHRSGESEFLINRRPCRLKDIARIFLGTGLGGRGYGVIEQGKVEQIIDQRPEERRLLLEEAAGVSRYRLQRAETLRKLDAAQANLTRLGDVLGEMRRQLGSLERQRRQAERHARLRERLKRLELAQAARSYLELAAELERAEAALGELMRQEHEAQSRRAGLTAEKARLESEIGAAVARREELQERLHALREELLARQAQAAALESEINLMGRERERLAQAAEDARRRAEQAAAALERCIQGRKQAGSERARQEALLESLPGRLEEAASELERLRQAADAFKGELVAAMAARSEAGNALRSLESRQAETAARLKRKEEEAARACGEAHSLKEHQAAATAQLADLDERLARVRPQAEALERAVAQTRARSTELTSLGQRRLAELDGLRSRLGHLQQLCSSARGEAAEGLLAAARELGVEHFLLADALQVDESVEAGLAAALGERLRAVVFASSQEALEAIGRYRQQGRGTALAVALDLLPAASQNEKGAVSFSAPLERLSAALGGLHVAADLAEAIKAGASGCTITRDGAALLPGGWLVARGKEPGSEVLAWQREARTLAERISGLEGEIEAGASELEAAEAAAGDHARHLEQARAEARELATRQAELEAESRAAAERLAAMSERLRLTEIEAERDRQALVELEAQMAEAAKRCQAVASEVAGCQERVAAALAKIREAEHRQAEGLEEQATLRASLAALGEREIAAGSEAERLARERTEAQAERERFAAEAEATALRATELAARRQQAERERTDLAERLRSLELEVEASERHTASLRASLGEVAGRLAVAEDELEALRGRLSESRIATSETALRLEAASRQARELHAVDLAPRARELAAFLEPATDAAGEARRVREAILRLGEVNPAAPREHEELAARCAETVAQQEDVTGGVATLRQTLRTIDHTCRRRFLESLEALNDKIAQVFTTLFGGGTARLELVGDDPLEGGIDIVAQPPGKQLVHMSLLSGGEKAMAATALLFALHLLRPSPFYLLDELDATLDDANVRRLSGLLRELAEKSQIIMVTHNKRTLEMADTLYGVTMEEPGVSKLVSVRLSEISGEG